MLILSTERRSSGHAYAGILRLRQGARIVTVALQHHPVGQHRLQAKVYEQWALSRDTLPTWQSDTYSTATEAINALLEHIAPDGLPDDLTALVTALLPDRPVGTPTYSLS